ncbi:MAG: YciI family protein [Nocardioides sp.]
MRFMMFVVADPTLAAQADPDLDELTIDEWLDEVEGSRVIGDRLVRPEDARTVHVSRGEVVVSDGPYAETKEWIAGFDVIDADSWDDAVRIASRHPQANGGRLELRPFWTDED